MKITTGYTIITSDATLFDAQGYVKAHGVQISDHGDTIGVNSSEHLKSDLIIGDKKITSALAGWELTW